MSSIKITTDSGELSATLDSSDAPVCTLLLAHGAGADHQHAHMQSLAQSFCDAGMTTLRFNFPFKQAGKNRVDSKAVSTSVIVSAAKVLKEKYDLPLFVGGHSFGGRMATHAVAEGLLDCQGMILCSFPLHPAGKPGSDRAAHLPEINVPMLFLSGTRDALAEPDLLAGVVDRLSGNHQLHWLDTADHSFKILKRTRQSELTVYEEVSAVGNAFVRRLV